MTAIYKRELSSYFHSFIGCLFIGATLLLTGIYFTVYNLLMGYPYIGYALSSVIFLFMISIPILAMRILAEERRQKTDQLIMTSPVTICGIVMGKYLALATIFVIPVAVIALYPLLLSLFGTVPFLHSYVALLGFFLYGLASMAICVFISSLTESQVIAAVLSFGALFLSYIMSGLCNIISQTGNLLTKILSVFDMSSRFDDFLNGSLQIGSTIYFLTVIVLFLIFTMQSIQKRRYQVTAKTISMSVYSSTVIFICTAVAVLLNVIVAEIPTKYTIFDVTSNKLYSLTDTTKEFVNSLQEDINIYVIANEAQADSTLDTTLKNYAALSGHINVSYVDPAVNPKFFANYTDATISSNSIIIESSKRNKVIDYYEIYQSEMDYNTYSSTVTGYDGEGQITSALAYVTTEDMPKIYMLEGHGELELDNAFRNIITKENIECETINLMNFDIVPEDAQCIIINAPTADFSEDDTAKMLAYMEKGGNVLITSAYSGKEMPQFNKLLNFFEVELSKGLIIEDNKEFYYQDPFYLLPEITPDGITNDALNSGSYVFAPYSQGLTITESESAESTILLSSSENSYVREDIEGSTDYAKTGSDIDGPFTIGVKCVKSTGEASSTGIIYTSENIFTQEADSMVAGTNSKLFTGTLNSFIEHSTSVSVPVKNYDMSYLTIVQSNLVLLGMLTIIIIPFTIMTAGFILWFRRRKR